MKIDNEFIKKNNERILSTFSSQQRMIQQRCFAKKEEPKDEVAVEGEIKLRADEKKFLMCVFTHLYKLTMTEIYREIGLSACKGTRISKKLEKDLLIKIINISKGKGVSKYPVLSEDAYKVLNVEQKKFEGKGCGHEHLIWQHILAEHFKEYKAVIELNRGDKCIDIAFEYESKLIAIEVAMTSAHEKENIEKDIGMAKAGLVIIGCKDEKVLNEVTAIIGEFGEELNRKARAFILSRISGMNVEEISRP
jgi:very-short-patch-repair endonuclease